MHIDKLVRTKRKTVALHVNEQSEVVVRAPRWVSRSFIDAFVLRHISWIESEKLKTAKRLRYKKTFTDGEVFILRGASYTLRFSQTAQNVELIDENILLPTQHENPREIIEKWYKKQAKAYLHTRTHELAQKHGFEVGKIRITSAKTRWGSCSGKGNINFSWRLIMAPELVIDYVIYHELAHLRHMNHSKRFWSLVGGMCPEYQSHQEWLHTHGERLAI